MYNCSFIVYDLETGGLISSKTGWIPPITEFACSVLDNKLDVVDEVDFFIKPYRPESEYQAAALSVSNITLERCEEEGRGIQGCHPEHPQRRQRRHQKSG